LDFSQWRIQEFLKVGAVKQKGGAVMIKVEYFGEKSLESSKKSVSKGGAVAPTSSAVDPPLISANGYQVRKISLQSGVKDNVICKV
jgi:hypothetical protein